MGDQTWALGPLVTTVFLRAILAHGAKTLTHAQRILENYADLLRRLRPSALQALPDDPAFSSVVAKDAIGVDDGTFFRNVLDTTLAFWKRSALRRQWTLELLVRLSVIPPEIVQDVLLGALPLAELCLPATQETFAYLARYLYRSAVHAEDEARRLKRAAMDQTSRAPGSTMDDKIDVDEIPSRYTRHDVEMLVLHFIVKASERATTAAAPTEEGTIVEDEGYVAVDKDGAVALRTEDVGRQLLLHASDYGRMFLHLLSAETLQQQSFPPSATTVQALHSLFSYLHPAPPAKMEVQ